MQKWDRGEWADCNMNGSLEMVRPIANTKGFGLLLAPSAQGCGLWGPRENSVSSELDSGVASHPRLNPRKMIYKATIDAELFQIFF